MPRDLIEELTNISLSRMQRETLERWICICMTAGEPATADACRKALSEQQEREAA